MLPSPASTPTFRRRRRTCLYRLERLFCNIATYFPLALVLGLTTWAIWVEVQIGLLPSKRFGKIYIFFGILIYILLNWSYLTAVFTDPGTPSKTGAFSDDFHLSSVTVKSTGEMRYCKKCQAKKPDRAHHCSSCRRCVLKMDHHCPWLATCVGLRNYKAFLLFLIYTTLFCWLCFWVSATWLWREVMDDTRMDETMMPVHFVILSVVSGIIGLVIAGFTAYHLYLTSKNRTTIESLESTRYLSPVKSHVSQQLSRQRTYADPGNHSFGEQLRDLGNTLTEIHVNALPGVLRPEEGEERMSPAQHSLRHNMDWNAYSRQREHEQYIEYLDEQDNEKLPNAFNLGWRRNFRAVMGPNLLLWPLPICNSLGDGWRWEQSEEWKRLRSQLRQEREIEMQRQAQTEQTAGWGARDPRVPDVEHAMSKADRVLGRYPGQFYDSSSSPKPPRRKVQAMHEHDDPIEDSSDEEDADSKANLLRKWPQRNAGPQAHPGTRVAESWNDIPDEMIGDKRLAGRKR